MYGIIAAVVGGITLIGCMVFLIQMQHPEDNNAAWLPKLIVLLGLFLACCTILLLPFDASMSQACETDPDCGVVGTLGQVWYIVFISIAVMVFVVIPLAYFWYETDDEDGMCNRICTTICWSTVNLFVFISILLGLYFSIGYVQLPVTVILPWGGDTIAGSSSVTNNTYLVDPSVPLPMFNYIASAPPDGVRTAYSATQNIQTSLTIYILALLSFIGWFLTTIFGGMGFVAMPMDLIGAWYNRPVPIDLKQFAEKKLQLKKRCEELISVGKETQGKFKGARNSMKMRRFANKYRKMVLDLEDEVALVNLCYKRNDINPLIPWGQLILGIISAVLSISWMVQLILEVFLQGLLGPYLSDVFQKLTAAFPLFGVVAYGIFAFYLLACVVKGSIKFAGRFFLISIHPLKANGTLMNSFLFNVGILLICSVSCTQLCATAFAQYAHGSAISQLFVSQIQYLRGLSYFYSVDIPVFYSLLFIIGMIQMVYSLVCIFFCAKQQAETVADAMAELRREQRA